MADEYDYAHSWADTYVPQPDTSGGLFLTEETTPQRRMEGRHPLPPILPSKRIVVPSEAEKPLPRIYNRYDPDFYPFERFSNAASLRETRSLILIVIFILVAMWIVTTGALHLAEKRIEANFRCTIFEAIALLKR